VLPLYLIFDEFLVGLINDVECVAGPARIDVILSSNILLSLSI
jgi:hypothetical protein